MRKSGGTTPTPAPPGWEDYLDPGETILWQGGPDPSIVLSKGVIGTALFGLAFAGFALFWMIMASMAGGGFWMFGLLHFSVGLGILAGAIFWPPWRRRHSWYTLTNRRAFIATALPFMARKLKSYPITPESNLEFEQGPLSTIHFHSYPVRTKNGHRTVRIGFERVPDGDKVFALMRRIQTGDQPHD